jgi:hypothetical protein
MMRSLSGFVSGCAGQTVTIYAEDVMKFLTSEPHCALMSVGISEYWEHYKGPNQNLWCSERLGKDGYFGASFPRNTRA